MEKEAKVFVAGHETMAGAALLRRAKAAGYRTVLPQNKDLTDQKNVFDFFNTEKPDYVFIASAKVGGILANSRYPAEFIYLNVQTQTNVIHAAKISGVKKLLYLGSSCMYPKESTQPMKEEYLMTGKLEPTSEPYAIAKIAGFSMCQSYQRQYGAKYFTAVPADMYGPLDDFNPETGHVLAALIAKMHLSKTKGHRSVKVWGTGSPKRECLHVDDMADACFFLMDKYDGTELINIGSGQDISIREMAGIIKDAAGFKGDIIFDTGKPDGMPRKLLDAAKISHLGWSPKISTEAGIRQAYDWYVSNLNTQ